MSAAAITWAQQAVQYDTGNFPSVAQGLNAWAEVHQGGWNDNSLWYHQGGYVFDYGWFPSIATDIWGNYITIHQGSNSASPLWYKIGFDNGSGLISFVNGVQNDWGANPVIAVHGHPYNYGGDGEDAFANLIQVHQGQSATGSLWMNFGSATNINQSTNQWGGISWLGAQEYVTSGAQPSVAITSWGPGSGCFLEVHQATLGYGTVYFLSGQFTGTNISITNSGSLTSDGESPSVCVADGWNGGGQFDTGVVVLEYNNGQLLSFDGPIGAVQLQGTTGPITPCYWTPKEIQTYDYGYYPRVSCQHNGPGPFKGIEVHHGAAQESPMPLWYRTFTQ